MMDLQNKLKQLGITASHRAGGTRRRRKYKRPVRTQETPEVVPDETPEVDLEMQKEVHVETPEVVVEIPETTPLTEVVTI